MKIKNVIKNFMARAAMNLAGLNGNPGREGLFLSQTKSGAHITVENSFNVPAVYACLRVLSNTLSVMPMSLRRKIDNRKSEDAAAHPVHNLFANEPNPEQVPSVWKRTQMLHVCTWGNAYNYIQRDGYGRPRRLWMLMPNRMNVIRNAEGIIEYHYTFADGRVYIFKREDVLHIPGLSFDGVVGKSIIGAHRETIGLAVSAQEYGARFFSSGGNLKGVLSIEGALDKEQTARIRDAWNDAYNGENAHKTAVLEGGAKYEAISIPPNDAQFIETRAMQDEQIASIFGVPLPLIQKTEKTTSWGSGIEQLMIAFIQITMLPFIVTFEETIKQKLLTEEEKQNHYIKFKTAGLLRGDFASRMNGYRTGRYMGMYSTNEIRELEDMNPIPGGDDDYWMPTNMTILGKTNTGDNNGQKK